MSYKIGAYVRISREEAAQIVEGSIPSQKHRIQSFIDIRNAQSEGWGKVVEIYADEGISAKDMNRPAFQRMMKDIRKGKVNMILVTELSRLSRSIMDFCHILEELKKNNSGFLSIKEQFDTSTPAGEMMVFNMINLAQFERKQTAERVALNFHSRAMRGLLNGGHPPLGFDKDPQKKCTYVVNEGEAAQVREIFQNYLSAGSLSKTIAKLNETGIGPKVRKEKCRVWTVDNLSAMLRNRSYIGEREINKQNKEPAPEVELKQWQKYQVVKASWPGILNPDTFEEVQRRLNEALASERTRRNGMETRYFWLSGIIRCPECGKPFNGASAHGHSEVYRYYSHQPIKGHPVTCKIRRISAPEIEGIVEKYLGDILDRTGALDAICARIELTGTAKKKDCAAELDGLKKRKSQLEVEIEKLISLKLVSQEQMVLELFEERLKNMGLERKVLDTRIHEIGLFSVGGGMQSVIAG
jgi:site-specific DNA recombinase